MASNENNFLARAEASPTPWIPPTPGQAGLFNAAYDAPTTATQGTATIAQAQQIPTLTADQTTLLFTSLGGQDMATFVNALPATDQQALNTAVAAPNLTFQSLSQAFSQLPPGDIQTALAALPPASLQSVLSVMANATNQGRDAGSSNATAAITPAAYTPGDAGTAASTTTNPQLSQDQMALVFTQLPTSQDMSAVFNALPAADQALLQPTLNNPNATLGDLVKAFEQVPQADLTTAFAQIPGADMQTAIAAATAATQQQTEVATNPTANPANPVQVADASQPVPQSGPAAGADLSPQLAKLTTTQMAQLLDGLPQADQQAFFQALPAGDQQALSQVTTPQLLAQALMGLPQQDVIAALSKVPTADLQTAITEVAAPTAAQTDASQPSSGSNWVKWGAASLVAGGGGLYAYKKFDLGTKLAGLDLGGKLNGLKSSIPDSLSGLASRFRPAAPGAVVPDVVPNVVADAVVPNAANLATDGLAKVVAETSVPVAENLTAVAADSVVPLATTGLKEAVEGGLSGTLGHAVESGATDLLVTGGEKTALSVAADVLGDAAKVAEL